MGKKQNAIIVTKHIDGNTITLLNLSDTAISVGDPILYRKRGFFERLFSWHWFTKYVCMTVEEAEERSQAHMIEMCRHREGW